MKHIYTLIVTLFFATLALAQNINLTVSVPEGTTSVRFTGPWWQWDTAGGPEASDNGDNTWTVNMAPGGGNMEYLWVVDGVQESLIANAANTECPDRVDAGTLITDYWSYANRVWILGSGDVPGDTYDTCADSTLGINHLSKSNVNIYPNPVNNTLNISAGSTIDAVNIFDLTGREVLRATPNVDKTSLDVSSLNKGFYLLTVKSGNQELTTKLVK